MVGIRKEFEYTCLLTYGGKWSEGYARMHHAECEIKNLPNFFKMGKWTEERDKALKKGYTEATIKYKKESDNTDMVISYTVGAGSRERKHNFNEVITKKIMSKEDLEDVLDIKLSKSGVKPSPETIEIIINDIIMKANRRFESTEKFYGIKCLFHRLYDNDIGIYITCSDEGNVNSIDNIKERYNQIEKRLKDVIYDGTYIFQKTLKENTKPEKVMETLLKKI